MEPTNQPTAGLPEPITFVSPNGYIVTLKPRLTYGEYNRIKQAVREKMFLEVNPNASPSDMKANDVKVEKFNLAALSAGNDIAISIIVLKVTDANGLDLGDVKTAIDNLYPEDGEAIIAKVNEITNASVLSKKKGIS